MVQNRKLSVTSFLLNKGSSSQGSVSWLEWKNREMEPQVTVFSQGRYLFGSQLAVFHLVINLLWKRRSREQRPDWEPEMELQVLRGNQSKQTNVEKF